jgi:S1-C subfamily serine protease
VNISRRNLLLALLFAALALGLISSGSVPQASSSSYDVQRSVSGRVVSLLDYFRSGESAVDRFLRLDREAGTDEHLATTIARCQRASVRVEVRFIKTSSAYHSVHGSGVLVDNGRKVLTAGHSFEASGEREIRITLHNGEVRNARIMARDYRTYDGEGHDWAIMELLGPPVVSVPSATLGEAQEGDLAIVLGYPDQIGIDATGEVAHLSEAGRFLPLVTLGTVLQRDPLLLSPTAGSIPVGGMSGGPIFDRRGRLVGIFSSVARIVQLDGARYLYNGTPLENLPSPQELR